MKETSSSLTPLLSAILAGTFLAGLSGGVAHAQSIIKIDGSSTVFPVTEAVAEEFQSESGGKVKVTVGISGTGGGFKKFTRGETDLQNASRPILKAELEACKENGIEFIELPICYDAVTVAVNPSNTWLKAITIADLKKMWEPTAQGTVSTWKQVNPQWPAQSFTLFGPGADSGTFDYFTEAVVGKAKSSRGDYTASEDDNTLVRGIEGNKEALGYIPFAYYAPHADKMRAVPVDAGKGPILPSAATIKDGTYPLARPLFIYVSVKSLAKPEVKQFVSFYLKNAATLAEEVKYQPLPPKAYELATTRFTTGVTGSVFKGEPEVHVTIEDLLQRGAAK